VIIEPEPLASGADARLVVGHLVRSLKPESDIRFARLPIPPAMQDRLPNNGEVAAIIKNSLQLRDSYDFPFWDGVLLLSERSGNVPDSTLIGAGFHQPLRSALQQWSCRAEEVSASQISHLEGSVHPGEILVLLSEVRIASEVRHIPMLDFALPSSSENDSIVHAVVSKLDVAGYLLNSGNSYHFYGERLVETEEWRAFLGKALLFSPLVDHRWIGHQLIEGCAALRISKNSQGALPTLVARVSP
jgi:hypothetical protein